MITHNGTYLLHATHNGMPIYVATMGGKMVIGGKWLSSATLQAIVAAFGSEGGEVIVKTNDYLNQIATTDPQRALLLAGFINEDPMLVCSLVETSKVRGLKGDRLAYINTGYYVNDPSQVELHIDFQTVDDRNLRVSPYIPICGARSSDSTQTLDSITLWSYELNKNLYVRCDIVDDLTAGNGLLDDLTYQSLTASVVNKTATMDGVVYKGNLKTKSRSSLSFPFHIFHTNEILGRYYGGTIYKCRLKENNEDKVYCIPHLRTNGEAGMLDIISGTFYPNANTQGSFTIALTDKTAS